MSGALSNAHTLMFIRGWQGGCLSQIAEELGVSGNDIQNADGVRMGELARIAQRKLYETLYNSGFKSGQEAMRERAGVVADDYSEEAHACAAEIRALPIEEPKA